MDRPMQLLKTVKWDWKKPDYALAMNVRIENLKRLREHPENVPYLMDAYRKDPASFIADWGMMHEPRNVEIGLPAMIPFVIFPKQREFVDYVIDKWRNRRPGLIEKSRDVGATWLSMALSCTLCILFDGMTIGFGSRKGEYVDKIGTLKPIFPKGRIFMENVPPEFTGEWVAWRDAPFMRITFPRTHSLIAGEGGDDIGRGDRTSIYFVDEAAHLPRPELVEASLSQTTNCRIDMSSVRGMANPFAQKRWGGKIDVFIFDWRDDPRKDDAWYAKQCQELDPVVVAQEIDRDYAASVKGVVIPGVWVRAAIDAHRKLGIAPAGDVGLSFDVADEGEDKNAVAICKGTEVLETEEWSGKGSDVFASTEYVFDLCDDHGLTRFRYDADGIGADVRGDARVINERRQRAKARQVRAVGYRGSEAVVDPEGIVEGTIGTEGDKGRRNEDYFANHKAQSWWALRKRFQKTYRWVRYIETNGEEGALAKPDDIISLSPKNPNLMKLVSELSQATFKQNDLGKIVIEKKPEGTKSPNQADAVVIQYAPMAPEPVEVTGTILNQIARAGRI
jgi:phage terminase large subunit